MISKIFILDINEYNTNSIQQHCNNDVSLHCNVNAMFSKLFYFFHLIMYHRITDNFVNTFIYQWFIYFTNTYNTNYFSLFFLYSIPTPEEKGMVIQRTKVIKSMFLPNMMELMEFWNFNQILSSLQCYITFTEASVHVYRNILKYY